MIARPRLQALERVLPDELQALTTWVPWVTRPRPGGGIGKVPALPNRGQLRPVDGRTAHLCIQEAHHLAERHGAAGLGVVLGADSGLCALDLDGPLGTGAFILLRELDAYAERSPSGTGVHLWLSGTLESNRRRPGMELLSRGLVTVTGLPLTGRSRALGNLRAAGPLLGGWSHGHSVLAPARASPPSQSQPADRDVLCRLLTARNGERARHLLDGDAQGYPSLSEADLALARMLRFYTLDEAQLERLMRRSALCRSKWGPEGTHVTYLFRTIRRALDLGGPVYTPRNPR